MLLYKCTQLLAKWFFKKSIPNTRKKDFNRPWKKFKNSRLSHRWSLKTYKYPSNIHDYKSYKNPSKMYDKIHDYCLDCP